MSKQPVPTASAIGLSPTIIQTGSLPRTIAPPDHPNIVERAHRTASKGTNIICHRSLMQTRGLPYIAGNEVYLVSGIIR